MVDDLQIIPMFAVDAPFDRAGTLDLRFLFAEVMGELGAPPIGAQVSRSLTPAQRATVARGRKHQFREYGDFLLGAVADCLGRQVEVLVVRHLERSGLRAVAAVPGTGTETLVQFAAAAGVVLVLSGGYEVLDYRTTATTVAEVRVRRYDPGLGGDVAEFARLAAAEIGDLLGPDVVAEFARLAAAEVNDLLGPDVVAESATIRYLMAQTLGSVEQLRTWARRARALLAARSGSGDPIEILKETVPARLHELKTAAQRILAAEAKLAAEDEVTVEELLDLLATKPAVTKAPPLRTPRAAHPDGLRPGERGLIDDPVGEPDAHAA